MKNKLSLLFAFLFAVAQLSAQVPPQINLNQNATSFELTENTQLHFKANNAINTINVEEIDTQQGTFARLSIDGYTHTHELGKPELPVISRLIEVPQGAHVQVTVTSFDEEVIQLSDLGVNAPLYPCQPSQAKCDDPDNGIFHYDAQAYQKNAFTKEAHATVEMIGTMRGTRIARLSINPFVYNPVTNELHIANNMEIEVKFPGADLGQTQMMKQRFFSPYFAPSFDRIINYDNSAKELITVAPVKYVIVSDPQFEDALQPFIAWKKKKGFNVIEAYTDDANVGTTTTSIKNYLQGLYDNATGNDPAPSFVLFVGDIDQIPAFNGSAGSHVTDLYYCEYTNDILPEVYYGRFSANNVSELQPQIDKTLEYEQFLMPDPSFLDEVVMVAGADGSHQMTWGNGQINYGTTYYFNEAHGITSHTYLQPLGSGAAADIRQNVSDGVAFANYTAHCSPSGWADPSFTISDVSSLQNANQYPLMIGNCCSSVEFQIHCFGEELLRAENKGALGYIGGSNSTYWDEDYWFGVGLGDISANPTYEQTGLGAYDCWFHDHDEDLADWYVTQGQVVSGGNLAVTEGGSRVDYYWEIYHLMGDPSLTVYTPSPETLVATYNDVITVGEASLAIATEAYAYVGISRDGELMGAGIADENGDVTIEFEAINTPGLIDVVITKQNRQPHIEQIMAIVPSGPYVVMDNCAINDIEGNENGMADYMETVDFDVTLKNVGVETATGVTATITCEDEHVTILEDSYTFGDIDADELVTVESAFQFQVSNNVPDQHGVTFTMEIADAASDETWEATMPVTINAPVMDVEMGSADIAGAPVFTSSPETYAQAQHEYTYDVTAIALASDVNGNLDPGEITDISAIVANLGHALSREAVCTVTSLSDYVTVLSGTFEVEPLQPEETKEITFTVQVDESTPIGEAVEFEFTFEGGEYSVTQVFSLKVGLIIEDFESGDFSGYDWVHSGDADWTIDTDAYEGTYSAKSGTITDDQTSELSITRNVMMDDVISFYFKVSSESSYDYLRFYIDGAQQDEWSGDASWTMAEYDVTAGEHTFTWKYEKDYSVSSGSDCGWIDLITLPSSTAAKDGDTKEDLTITGTQVPEWLTLEPGTENGTATLSGTPEEAHIGEHEVVLTVTDQTNSTDQSFTINVDVAQAIDAIEGLEGFEIYPNPVKDAATITYTLSETQDVSISLFNLLGEEVQQLQAAKSMQTGSYSVELNTQNITDGVYVCKMVIGEQVLTQRIVISR